MSVQDWKHNPDENGTGDAVLDAAVKRDHEALVRLITDVATRVVAEMFAGVERRLGALERRLASTENTSEGSR